MAWFITAAGECSPELEHELAGLLSEILSEKDFGVTASQMGGHAVNGPVHGAPKKEKPPARK